MVSTSSAQSNLWTAAGEGDLDRVKHLVEVQETAADARDEHGYTALHAAVSWGHPEMLRYLTSKGGDINVTDNDGEWVQPFGRLPSYGVTLTGDLVP